jgi:hypothetical protein
MRVKAGLNNLHQAGSPKVMVQTLASEWLLEGFKFDLETDAKVEGFVDLFEIHWPPPSLDASLMTISRTRW